MAKPTTSVQCGKLCKLLSYFTYAARVVHGSMQWRTFQAERGVVIACAGLSQVLNEAYLTVSHTIPPKYLDNMPTPHGHIESSKSGHVDTKTIVGPIHKGFQKGAVKSGLPSRTVLTNVFKRVPKQMKTTCWDMLNN